MNRSTSAFAPLCSIGRAGLLWGLSFLLGTANRVPCARAQGAGDGSGRPLPSIVWSFLADSSRALWIRPLSSAAIPGLGQLLGDRDRGAAYLITEAFLVSRFVAEQREAQREAERYKDLAFRVARRAFNPTVRDTAFGYFEEMAKFIESGPFDVDPGPALVPPLDERTYNGWIWKLARETFFPRPDSLPDPGSLEYQRALEFYRRRAVGPGFLWSWRQAALEHEVFKLTIKASDRAFRNATQYLGLTLANHLLSMVDAFVTERLGFEGRSIEFGTGLRSFPGRGEGRLMVQGRIGF